MGVDIFVSAQAGAPLLLRLARLSGQFAHGWRRKQLAEHVHPHASTCVGHTHGPCTCCSLSLLNSFPAFCHPSCVPSPRNSYALDARHVAYLATDSGQPRGTRCMGSDGVTITLAVHKLVAAHDHSRLRETVEVSTKQPSQLHSHPQPPCPHSTLTPTVSPQFDSGVDNLAVYLQQLAASGIPTLGGCNVDAAGEPSILGLFKKWEVKEVAGVKVGRGGNEGRAARAAPRLQKVARRELHVASLCPVTHKAELLCKTEV